jgi:para-nitrobenzyl esterase
LKNDKFVAELLIVAALLVMPAGGVAATETPLLKVSGGVIKGRQEGNIRVYKGIPYAKPPVGELRFAPPQDAEPWADELNCADFGRRCMQVFPFFANPQALSEDCLTLNVWTPAKAGEAAALPVYVFIHGGGFAAGSGAFSLYNGENFAKKGIVAVTINYRLGALGFFASRETLNRYGTTGNWGILDQIKALEWVRDNIAAFGGDPGKVTVGGESAGSFSVSALMTSPLAAGLFRGVIMESGSILSLPALSYYARSDLQKSIEVSGMLADIFGAADDADGLEKMRRADADVLAYFSVFIPDQTTTPAFFLTPVFDGGAIPEDPLGAVSSGAFAKVNLLLGFNNDEGSLFVPEKTGESGYKTLTMRAFGGEKGLRILERFRVDAEHTALQRARQTLAYGVFTAGIKRFADIIADAGGKVYMYKFNYDAPDNRRNGLGAAHAMELPFVFNNGTGGASSDRASAKLADEMHTRWANFIKTGDVNVGDPLPSDVQWPKYDSKDTGVLYLDEKITAGPLVDRENIDYAADLLFGGRN